MHWVHELDCAGILGLCYIHAYVLTACFWLGYFDLGHKSPGANVAIRTEWVHDLKSQCQMVFWHACCSVHQQGMYPIEPYLHLMRLIHTKGAQPWFLWIPESLKAWQMGGTALCVDGAANGEKSHICLASIEMCTTKHAFT